MLQMMILHFKATRQASYHGFGYALYSCRCFPSLLGSFFDSEPQNFNVSDRSIYALFALFVHISKTKTNTAYVHANHFQYSQMYDHLAKWVMLVRLRFIGISTFVTCSFIFISDCIQYVVRGICIIWRFSEVKNEKK